MTATLDAVAALRWQFSNADFDGRLTIFDAVSQLKQEFSERIALTQPGHYVREVGT
jgi:hypothetical protein